MKKITHEHLQFAVQNLPEDYEPYGQVDRQTADKGNWAPDCSCGCLFYAQLEGMLGLDWGVCANPESHRVGLLTFEHQGCIHFEKQEDESED